MKLKILRKFKTDVFGYTMPNFRKTNFLKNYKLDLHALLRKNSLQHDLPAEVVSEIKDLLDACNGFELNFERRRLDFTSKNQRNVFLRTKRKSSYGLTLLEKQKVRAYFANISNPKLKTRVLSKRDVLDHSHYVFHASGVFGSKRSLRRGFIQKTNFGSHESFPLYGYHLSSEAKDSSVDSLNLPILRYQAADSTDTDMGMGGAESKDGSSPVPHHQATSTSDDTIDVFRFPLPSNLLVDYRLNKIYYVGWGEDASLTTTSTNRAPFDFDPRKLSQHYRIKRS